MTQPTKGKIAVLIEEHFDATEFKRFNEFFPENGYDSHQEWLEDWRKARGGNFTSIGVN